VTYEGITQGKESKINMVIHQYELSKRQPGKFVKEMFTQFANETNNLKSLEKTYPIRE